MSLLGGVLLPVGIGTLGVMPSRMRSMFVQLPRAIRTVEFVPLARNQHAARNPNDH